MRIRWLLAVLVAGLGAVAHGAALDLEQPLAAIAKTVSCDRVYRFTIPLRGEAHTLTMVFAFPSHQQLRATGVTDTAERVAELSTLRYAEKKGDSLVDRAEVPVNKVLFKRLLGALGESEAFALPAEKPLRYEDYLAAGVLDEGLFVAERYAGGEVKVLRRVHSESAAPTYLANRLALILGKAVGKEWQVGSAEPDQEDLK